LKKIRRVRPRLSNGFPLVASLGVALPAFVVVAVSYGREGSENWHHAV
jgi:hypothetical protein